MLSIHTTDGDKVGNKPTVALIVFVWVRASLHVGCCVVPYSVLSMFSVFVGVFAEPASVLQNPADCVYTSTGIPTWSLTYLSLSSSCYITISRLSLSCLIYPISISLSIICNYPLLSLFSVFTKDEYSLTHCIVCQTVFTQQQGENGSSSPHVSPGENGVDDVNQDIDTVRPHHVPHHVLPISTLTGDDKCLSFVDTTTSGSSWLIFAVHLVTSKNPLSLSRTHFQYDFVWI